MRQEPTYIQCKECGKDFRAVYDYRTGLLKSKLCSSCQYQELVKKAKKKLGNDKSQKINDRKSNRKNAVKKTSKKYRPPKVRIDFSDVFDEKGNLSAEAIKKYRDIPTKILKNRAVYWFNKFIRLRDTDEYGYGTCISSCQPLMYGTRNCQAGHFYPAGQYPRLKFNENNVNLQGKSDNYYKSGNLLEYRKRLEKKIGETKLKELDRIAASDKKIPYKESKFFYITIIHKYKEKCKELEKTKIKRN